MFNQSKLSRVGRVLQQSVEDFFKDNGPQWAAAIAYHTMLSIFPLMLALVAITAYFIEPNWAIQQVTQWLGTYLPGGTEQISSVIQGAVEASGRVSILSILAFLWSGSRVFSAMTKALNIAYQVEESYSFLKRTLLEFVMMITIGLLFMLALVSGFFLNWLASMITFLPGEGILLRTVRFALPGLLLMASFYLTYRFVPRKRVATRAALIGALLAAALFLAARPLFTGYVRRFASYNLVYGPLAVLIILIIWFWIFGMILLLCGEVVSHIQDMLIEGLSEDEVERRRRINERSRKAADS